MRGMFGMEPLDPVAWEAVRRAKAGDVVQIRSRRYKVTKKTTTAVAVKRWFWWDEIGEAVGDIWERLVN